MLFLPVAYSIAIEFVFAVLNLSVPSHIRDHVTYINWVTEASLTCAYLNDLCSYFKELSEPNPENIVCLLQKQTSEQKSWEEAVEIYKSHWFTFIQIEKDMLELFPQHKNKLEELFDMNKKIFASVTDFHIVYSNRYKDHFTSEVLP